MKLLLDTNVLVSKAIGGRRAAAIVNSATRARWRLYTSQYILAEVHRILTAKLGAPLRLAQIQVDAIQRHSAIVGAESSRHVVPGDRADDPVLQAAVLAGVDFLVTDDVVLQRLSPYEGIRIISTSELERVMREMGVFEE